MCPNFGYSSFLNGSMTKLFYFFFNFSCLIGDGQDGSVRTALHIGLQQRPQANVGDPAAQRQDSTLLQRSRFHHLRPPAAGQRGQQEQDPRASQRQSHSLPSIHSVTICSNFGFFKAQISVTRSKFGFYSS